VPAAFHSGTAANERRWQLRSYLLDRVEFNELRARLPRAVRRDVDAAPEGHVGLVVQAIADDEGGTPLAILYDNAPASIAEQRVRELGQRLTELFG
jgi:hypothetical protein